MTQSQLLFGIALPLMWAAAMWGFWLYCCRGSRRPLLAGLLGASAVGGASAFAFFAFGSRGSFPPGTNVEWLFYVIPVVGLLAAGEGWMPRRFRGVVWALLLMGTIGLVSQNYVRNAEVKGWAVGVLAVWCLAGWDLRLTAGRMVEKTPKTGLLILGLMTVFLAASVGMHGSQPIAVRVGSLALGLLPVFGLLLFLESDRVVPASALTVWAVLLTGTTLAMYLYAQKYPLVEALLIAVAPMRAAALSEDWKGWKRAVAAVTLALVPLLVAFCMGLVPFIKEMAEDNFGY